jgi:DNA-binding CsgD family transcriptional regulator
MNSAALIAYFLVSYSVGLASLVVSLASWLKQRSRASRDYFLATLALSIVVACSTFSNIAGDGAPEWIVDGLELVNYACALACVFLLPFLVHSVYAIAGSKAWSRGFVALAATAAFAGIAFALAGRPEVGGNIVLGAKNLSIVYAVARIIANRGRHHDGQIENVLHYIMIATLVVFPFILASEHFPALLRSILPMDTRGSIALPFLYLIWSAAYLLSWFGGYIKPSPAAAASYGEFSARNGLSPREVEVLRLLLGGQSYKEIMASLSISMPTVKSHVGSIYRKTGCNNKMQLSLIFNSGSSRGAPG